MSVTALRRSLLEEMWVEELLLQFIRGKRSFEPFETERRLSAAGKPTHLGPFEAVVDKMATDAFDRTRGNRKAGHQKVVILHAICVHRQTPARSRTACCFPVQRKAPNSPHSRSLIAIPCRTAPSNNGDSVTANFTNTSDLPNSPPVVMLVTGIHALRHTARYARVAMHAGQFPTLPVFTDLAPQVRSHSFTNVGSNDV